jgi:hypothetical protein
MREKLDSPEGKAVYARRKAIVEPVFGQIKGARQFQRFSFRGLEKVAAEWDIVCWTHNLLKLFRSGKFSELRKKRQAQQPAPNHQPLSPYSYPANHQPPLPCCNFSHLLGQVLGPFLMGWRSDSPTRSQSLEPRASHEIHR